MLDFSREFRRKLAHPNYMPPSRYRWADIQAELEARDMGRALCHISRRMQFDRWSGEDCGMQMTVMTCGEKEENRTSMRRRVSAKDRLIGRCCASLVRADCKLDAPVKTRAGAFCSALPHDLAEHEPQCWKISMSCYATCGKRPHTMTLPF